MERLRRGGGGASRRRLRRHRRYCEGRRAQHYVLYLRWAYLSTRLSARSHNASVQHLLDYLEANRELHPHWGEFADRWQSSDRPCPLFVNEPLGGPDRSHRVAPEKRGM